MTQDGKYKYEIHCHTKEVSQCGQVPAAEIVALYKEKGYDGLVITDHYSGLTFNGTKTLRAHKLMDDYLKGYKAAKEAAGDDFTVLLGMELRGFCSPIDFLVYGMTEEFLRSCGNLLFTYSKRFYKMAKKNGFLVVAPHPFRMEPFLPNPKYIDGAEIFNGKESPDHNEKALQWCEENGIAIRTSGSDFHRLTHKNFSGILTREPIHTNEDLLRILRSGNYELILD